MSNELDEILATLNSREVERNAGSEKFAVLTQSILKIARDFDVFKVRMNPDFWETYKKWLDRFEEAPDGREWFEPAELMLGRDVGNEVVILVTKAGEFEINV
jgi:hypothetical protein